MRWKLVVAGVAATLLGAWIVRHVHEDVVRGSRTKPVFLGVITIGTGESVAQHGKVEASWASPFEADVVGWALFAAAPGATVTLLSADLTVLERRATGGEDIRPLFLPGGTGVRMTPQARLTLRLDGPPEAKAQRAMAIVYYVRAQ